MKRSKPRMKSRQKKAAKTNVHPREFNVCEPMSAKEVEALLRARLKETKTISHEEVRRRIKSLIERLRKQK